MSSTTPNAFKITAVAGALQIDKGRLYVDGLLAESHGAASTDPAKRAFDSLMAGDMFLDKIPYTSQPYLPGPPALPAAGRHLVYLDVWNREVTHLEQPDLVESAVAVETSSRLQTVWQVRVLASDAGTGTSCGTPDGQVPGWSDVIAPSTGVLSTGTLDIAPTDDPCELPPTGGYRGLENQLYRVEIHDPGQPGGTATFKWSRENASVGSRVASMVSATELELDSLGRDDVLRFSLDDWVEIIDDLREFSQRCGEIRKITVNEAARRISFTPALPAEMIPGAFPSSDFPRDRNLRVRRWDQKHKLLQAGAGGTTSVFQDLDAAGSKGVINVPVAGTTLLLENGVTVSFASTGAKGFKAGDHWEFAARTADASVELLVNAPPRGIHHHYARLGIWEVAAGTVSDCRNPWPPKVSTGKDCGCTQCVTPESHASGQLTIQAAVDKVRDTGGTVCLHAGQYVLGEPVRITAARSLRITGQGAATMIASPGAAFIIERSVAIAIDELSIFSLGRQSAISVRTVLGLALRKLAVAVFGNADAQGAAITLGGVVAGATIDNNLFIAPDGVRALEPPQEEAPGLLVSAVLRIDNNLFWCRDSAVRLAGKVGHAYETRMTGNQVLGSHEVGLSTEGFALPGASVRLSNNNLNLHGPGIRCAVDGAWIEGNKLLATRDGERQLKGAGIELVTGLDRNGSDQCQVLANQVSGFPEAGILIEAPVQALIIKLNIIEQCGNGILMTDSARAGSLAIENNQLRGIGLRASGAATGMTAGIGITRTEAATVAGNTLRQIGLGAAENKQLVAGIAAFSVQRPRISGNDIMEVGPLENFGGMVAGISVRAPYAQAEINHNHVERDAQVSQQPSDTAWFALHIDEPQPGGNIISRLMRYATLRVDDSRTLVLYGTHAYVNTVAAGVDATGTAAAVQGASASVLGNAFIARGRTCGGRERQR
ncbi:right-handed parallel beta-helix repeat-containing protein [Polaromonas sp. P2-4]|nr:right-handed parallel beta-helix repeat-containing protein [Polaromonas sp. P2-4]